jgi:hypothetical protein
MSKVRPHQIEPELQIQLPRPARVKTQTQATMWGVGLIGLAIACVIGWRASRDLGDLIALRGHGVTGQAVVTETRVSRGKSDSYYVSYMLRTQNGLLEDEDQVPYSRYEQIHEGDTLTVTYLSGQPETHRLGPVEDRRIWRQSGMWLLGMLGGTGILLSSS